MSTFDRFGITIWENQGKGRFMQCMISWKITPGDYIACARRFIETGGADVEGITTIGRWHAPGSSYGWHLVEGTPEAVAKQVAVWNPYISIEVTPVITDEAAAPAVASVLE